MVVGHTGVDIEPVDIVQIFLDATCHLQGYNLIVGFVLSVMVPIVLTNGFFYSFSVGAHCAVSLPPFQGFSCRAQANIGHPLFFVGGAGDDELVIQLKDPPFEFILVSLEFARGRGFASYHVNLVVMALLL